MSGGALPGTRRPRSDAEKCALRQRRFDRDRRHIYLFVTLLSVMIRRLISDLRRPDTCLSRLKLPIRTAQSGGSPWKRSHHRWSRKCVMHLRSARRDRQTWVDDPRAPASTEDVSCPTAREFDTVSPGSTGRRQTAVIGECNGNR